jgi:hypothetical protein
MSIRAQSKFKKRFRLSDEQDIINLLLFADTTRDIDLRRNFMLFYINCPEDIQDYLSESYDIKSPVEKYKSISIQKT